MLGGLLGYLWLPISSLPQVDFPTVTTQLPGASPDVMASLVTAPLGRNFRTDNAFQLMTWFVRDQPHHAAVRPQSRHRLPLSTPPGRRCRETCPTRRPTRRSTPRCADGDAGDHLGHHLAARPQRHCRHAAGAAAERTHRHGRRHGPAQRIKNELPKLLRWMPVGATHRGARRNRQHPSASVVTCTSR